MEWERVVSPPRVRLGERRRIFSLSLSFFRPFPLSPWSFLGAGRERRPFSCRLRCQVGTPFSPSLFSDSIHRKALDRPFGTGRGIIKRFSSRRDQSDEKMPPFLIFDPLSFSSSSAPTCFSFQMCKAEIGFFFFLPPRALDREISSVSPFFPFFLLPSAFAAHISRNPSLPFLPRLMRSALFFPGWRRKSKIMTRISFFFPSPSFFLVGCVRRVYLFSPGMNYPS